MYICPINLRATNLIANPKLHIERLKTHFKNSPVFEKKDLLAFYEQHETEIKLTALNWRIYYLVQLGILQRIGRGKFTLGEGRIYLPRN